MMNQMPARVWDGVLSVLTPGYLIDRILDWIDKLSGAIEPAQAARLPREKVRLEALHD